MKFLSRFRGIGDAWVFHIALLGLLLSVSLVTVSVVRAQTVGFVLMSGPTVADADIAEDTATVRWATNEPSSSVVRFGTTAALGEEYKKITPIEETEVLEINHSMSLWALQPGTKYFYKVVSVTEDGRSVESGTLTFTTKGGVTCTEDVWSCDAWGTCKDGFQTRPCTLKEDCPTVVTPKPSETQSCTAACTEDIWSCTAWGSCLPSISGASKQFRVCTLKTDCAGVSTAKPAEQQDCTAKCTEDIWSCSAWGECKDGSQTRTCTLKEDCPTVLTPKPSEKQVCKEACTEDIWSCSAWGECKDGSQSRTCTLKEDCPDVVTPKPEEKQACAATEACTEDVWSCSEWGACEGGMRRRLCVLKEDCPEDIQSVKPAEEEPCETEAVPIEMVALDLASVSPIGTAPKPQEPPSGTEGGQKPPEEEKKSDITLPIDTEMVSMELRSSLVDLHSAAYGGTTSASGAAEQPKDTTKHEFGQSGVGDENRQKLAGECEQNRIALDHCAEWMAAKYGDKRCRDAGIMTKEKCEAFLSAENDGTFPGCEGKGEQDCSFVKDRILTAYLSSQVKEKTDEAIKRAVQEHVAFTMAGVTAVSGTHAAEVAWRTVATEEGADTAPAALVFDGDKDGVPDDVEVARGTDPKSADTDKDGVNDGEELKNGTDPKGSGKLEKKLAPVEVALLNKVPLEHPAVSGKFDPGIKPFFGPKGGKPAADAGKPSGSGFGFTGEPNTTYTVWAQSYVPLVMTVTTDAYGQASVSLDDMLGDGEHTAYVAVTDETGKVVKKSSPLSFFVKEAQAVTMDDFLAPDSIAAAVEPAVRVQKNYFTISLAIIAVGVVAVLGILFGRKKKPAAK